MDRWDVMLDALQQARPPAEKGGPMAGEFAARKDYESPRTVWKIRVVRELVPAGRPPCFEGDAAWLAYLEHAACDTRKLHADGPVLWGGKAPAINLAFSYCADCTDRHEAAMKRERRCNPHWLRAKAPARETAEV